MTVSLLNAALLTLGPTIQTLHTPKWYSVAAVQA